MALFAVAVCPIGTAWADAPVVTIESPLNGSTTNDKTPSFSGATNDPLDEVKLAIYTGTTATGTPVQTLTSLLPTLGTWSLGPTEPLIDETYTAQAIQTNLFSEKGTSEPVTFTVDTVAPAVSLTGVTSPTSDATPSFSGEAGVAPGDITAVKLKVYAGSVASGSPVRTVEVAPNGTSWTSGAVAELGDGTYTAQAEQSDEAGNTGVSLPSTFRIDTTPPAITLSSPVGGSLTNSTSQLVEGEAGVAEGDLSSVTVELFAGLTIGGQAPEKTVVVQTSLGHWSTTFGGLSDGSYTLRAEQSDDVGNSGKSTPVTFTVDTVAPAVSLTAVTSPTADSTPSFSGKAGVAAGDIASVKLRVYAGTVVSGSPVRTIEAAPSGATWTSSVVAALGDGTYTAQAEQSDSAGNVGRSEPSTFRVDTTPPHITLTSPASNSLTNSRSQLVEGAVGVAEGDLSSVTIELFAGSSIGAQAPQETVVVQASSGHWAATFGGLSDGAYTVRAEQSDDVGNAGRSTPVTFTVDTVAPAVSLNAVTSPTADSTPSFSGKAGVATGDIASVKLKVYTGATASGSPVQTVEAVPSGANWTSGPVAALGDGTYTAEAEQSDHAGNVGRSEPVTFIVKAKGPKVTLTALPKFIGTATPTFSGGAGVAPEDIKSVKLKIYVGATVAGSPAQALEVSPNGATWALGPVAALQDGTYTAQAEQSDELHNTVKSSPSTFTVDTVAPIVSMAAVASPSSNSTPIFSGTAGVITGDIGTVTLKIYPGAVASGTTVQTLHVASNGGAWTAVPVAALGDGTYTAQAEQTDEAGNTGRSEPVTFTVLTPAPTTPEPNATPAHNPPAASFTWFPPTPNTGESVALVSNSTDASSPIAALAWSISGSGTFQAGGSVLTTSFSTPGPHVVRLRVAGADGLSSITTETIPVVSRHAPLMQPFPTVRIAGTDTPKGARLKLLTVEAPAGAKVTVRCHGRGCPSKSESRLVPSKGKGVGVVEFRRFERALRAGIVLEIRVSKSGEIGKYTRFQIRRNRLPERLDTCLSAAGVKPMRCPS